MKKKVLNVIHYPAEDNNLSFHLHSIRLTTFPLIPAVKLYQIFSIKMQTKQIPFSHLQLSTQIPTLAFLEVTNLGLQQITLFSTK